MTAPGIVSWLAYGWESQYGTASSTIDKAFGHGVKVTNLTRRNNIEKVFACGTRNAQKFAVKKFDGALSMDFVLSNPYFFTGVVGTGTDSGTASPWTHTYSEADTIPSITVENSLQLAAVRESTMKGGVIATCTITSAINELVRVRLDIPYANEEFATSTSAPITASYELYTFAQGTFELPDTAGSALAQVQNIELTIANNPLLVFGQGSRFAQEQAAQSREYTGSVTMALQASADLLEKFYGAATGPAAIPAEQADMKLLFTNGLTGTNTRSISLVYTGVQLDEDSMPQDPTAVIMEDVSISARSLVIAAIDATQTGL